MCLFREREMVFYAILGIFLQYFVIDYTRFFFRLTNNNFRALFKLNIYGPGHCCLVRDRKRSITCVACGTIRSQRPEKDGTRRWGRGEIMERRSATTTCRDNRSGDATSAALILTVRRRPVTTAGRGATRREKVTGARRRASLPSSLSSSSRTKVRTPDRASAGPHGNPMLIFSVHNTRAVASWITISFIECDKRISRSCIALFVIIICFSRVTWDRPIVQRW